MTQLLEFEAKALAREAGLKVPDGEVVESPEEALRAARALTGDVMVKAQVPSKGRHSLGGIIRARTAEECEAAARQLLGSEIGGHRVEQLLVESWSESDAAVYLGIILSASRGGALLVVSSAGGSDVEKSVDRLAEVPFSMVLGLRPWHVWNACSQCGMTSEITRAVIPAAIALFQVFKSTPALVVEANPLLISSGQSTAVDVRIVSDAAQSAYPDLTRAGAIKADHNFDFVALDEMGTIGLLTTGAGSSMLLVDLLQARGASPANFCDIRAGSIPPDDSSRIHAAFDEFDAFPNLRCIMVNIFAGVTDLFAFSRLLADVLDKRPVGWKVIARLEGLGAEDSRRLLEAHGVRCVESLEGLIEEAADAVAAGPRS